MINNDFELENKSHRHMCHVCHFCHYCHDCQRHYCDNWKVIHGKYYLINSVKCVDFYFMGKGTTHQDYFHCSRFVLFHQLYKIHL